MMIKILGIVLILTSCTQDVKTVNLLAARTPATDSDAIGSEAPRLIYSTYDTKGKAFHEEISSERWSGLNGGFSAGGREDYLIKMFYASTVGVSSRGILHSACFLGNAQSLQQNFFENETATVRNLTARVQVKSSSDGRKIGLKLNHKTRGVLFFRLSHCLSGKSTASEISLKPSRVPANEWPAPAAAADRAAQKTLPGSVNATGFQQIHKTKVDRKILPGFALRADFEDMPAGLEKKPWHGLDLLDPKEALLFALLAQKYVYENMANQNVTNRDENFIAAKNKSRYWCHMPWMNVGVNGREAIHGLTQERDLKSSTLVPTFKNATPGTNWGLAFFNTEGCQTIRDIFGSAKNPKVNPDFTKNSFPNETFITKILFTSANFPEIENAYKWNAHVNEVGSTERSIRTVRHIQMDIAVKDTSLKGVSPDLQNWAMSAFYYDASFDYDKEYKELLGIEHPIKAIPNLPPELLKMRPIGIQTGYSDPVKSRDTILFPGSHTNGVGGRLNGPADNPKTSCLGCHGPAGTQARMVPGFLSLSMFEPFRNVPNLDFNQQLALAKSNFETYIP